MTVYTEKDQERDWQTLHDAITQVLDRFGRKNAFGEGDYWLVDDNLGSRRHKLEFQNLDLVRLDILRELQALLTGYDEWYITVQIDVPSARDTWPGMGIIIYDDEIVDELRRDFLPDRFRDVVFGTIEIRTADSMMELVRSLMKPQR